ncbi:hypothetical protein [Ralstonia phage phiRSL1]|uniref:Uncharacterized protein n=1 Tax=Ralstonia phage phiRSL1 TaxID=1980924 RepID=B2ZXU3_9CAUD|nr:hypothetical protein RSL1_ORF073 [Ralstonia phage phiRSL1]BAG41519.1 hypothetical protein [Ralstonia phage phiRSL1]
MTRTPQFQGGMLVPTGELKVVDATVERVSRLDGQINATVIFEDELGIRFKIRGYGGGSIAAELRPLEWPTDVQGRYHFKGDRESWGSRARYAATASSKDEALAKIKARHKYEDVNRLTLTAITKPTDEDVTYG